MIDPSKPMVLRIRSDADINAGLERLMRIFRVGNNRSTRKFMIDSIALSGFDLRLEFTTEFSEGIYVVQDKAPYSWDLIRTREKLDIDDELRVFQETYCESTSPL